jgi:uncharacterized protein
MRALLLRGRIVGLVLGLALLGLLLGVRRAEALEPPQLTARVNDRAALLPAASASELEAKLAAHEKKTGHQFAILTIPSLEGDPIEDFSIRTVQKWKLGHAKVDDGLLVLVAKSERKVRIEVGYGLEGKIPDAIASRIIRNSMVPLFRRGDFAGGIEAGVNALIEVDDGGGASPSPQTGTGSGEPGGSGLALLILLIPMLGVFLLLRGLFGGFGGFAGGRWGGGYGGYGGYGGGSWGGGSSWGGGGGGGGFSGGGGGFGGGGASGGW